MSASLDMKNLKQVNPPFALHHPSTASREKTQPLNANALAAAAVAVSRSINNEATPMINRSLAN